LSCHSKTQAPWSTRSGSCSFCDLFKRWSHQRIQTLERHTNNKPVRKFDYLYPSTQTIKHRSVALITW